MTVGTTRPVHQEASNPYPWYDSQWLWSYSRGKHLLATEHPDQLNAFERALNPMRTRSDIRIQSYANLFDAPLLERLRRMIRSLKSTQLELHELPGFRRFIVHNHELMNELQDGLIDRVSEGCGERVEACYNFLSLYRAGAHC